MKVSYQAEVMCDDYSVVTNDQRTMMNFKFEHITVDAIKIEFEFASVMLMNSSLPKSI